MSRSAGVSIPSATTSAPELLAQRGHGPDQLLLDGLVVAAADEGHVQLDHVGLEDGEGGEPGVAGAEVVDGQPVAELRAGP